MEDVSANNLFFAEIVSSEPQLVLATKTEDVDGVAAAMAALGERFDVSHIDVFGAEGDEIHHQSHREDVIDGRALLGAALDGESATLTTVTEHGLIVQAASPIFDGTRIVGTVVVSRVFAGQSLIELAGTDGVLLALFNGGMAIHVPEGISPIHQHQVAAFDDATKGHTIIDDRYMPVPLALSERQSVIALVDISDQLQILQASRRTMILSVALVAVAAAILGFLLSRRLSRPIVGMTTVARRIATGRYDTRVSDLPFAELNTMGASLNHLAYKVQEQITGLEEAESRLRSSLDSKDRLIASVSHEVRTPLTAVVGYAQMLEDHSSEISASDRNEMVRHIASESVDLSNIIEDLFVASRAESGHLTVLMTPVDIDGQLQSVLSHITGARARQTVEVEPGTCMALGDASRIRQIIRNLVTNAFRYGGDRVRITSDHHHGHVVLIVADDGPPIATSTSEAIFEPYARAHEREGVTASVGLGLTISRQLATLMGGRLAYRHEGGWSEFLLTLNSADVNTQLTHNAVDGPVSAAAAISS